jgi:cytochrome c oxidase assembly protein subunit 11
MTARHPSMSSARLIVAICVVVVGSMVGLAYAAVPLYRIFCQVTGYGGTTRVASQLPDLIGEREMTVRFDANVSANLAWTFRPVQLSQRVKLGENALAFFRASNYSNRDTVGTATFNVTPLAAGRYFNKIECFCFTEQPLAAGESAEMPVSFFIDPSLDDDPDLDGVQTITLSYTYFPAGTGEGETPLDAGASPGQSRIN